MHRLAMRGVLLALCAAVTAAGCGASTAAHVEPARTPSSQDVGSTTAAELAPSPVPADLLRPMSGTTGLTIPDSFAIAQPEEPVSTHYETYFITGTSDPDLPVFFDGEEVERQGSLGTFGVFVELDMGENRFTFRQGDQTREVVITRTEEAEVYPISTMKQDTLMPSHLSGVRAGGTLAVGCTGPAGAAVEAAFEGQTVALTPSSTAAKTGTPIHYTGTIPIGESYERDVTAKIGPVSYRMVYNGEVSSSQSDGAVYVAGSDSDLVMEVANYIAFVYPDATDLGQFKETVKAGVRDYVVSETNQLFELASGGFIQKEYVTVVEGKAQVQSQLDSIDSQFGSKAEVYTFHTGLKPIYDSKIVDNTLYLTLYNTEGSPRADISSSRLVSSVKTETEEGSVIYAMALSGRVWGYDISLRDGELVLLLKYKPKLSSADSPLSGITVVVDPGHGGEDPGALGVAGKLGPAEKDVNLANALVLRDYLAGLGANVVMTRTTDAKVSLDERLAVFEESGGDFFVSVHHNSIGENRDSNKISGMEVYYHTGLSKPFGDSMMGALTTHLNRNNRSLQQSYFRVTMLPYAPALLLELGFMTNPLEYEKAVTRSEMDKVATAVADGIKRSLR